MLDFNLLILTSLTLLVISLFILFYLVVTKSKELDRLKQVLRVTIKKVGLRDHDCSHYMGYLFSFPRNRPIPNECMGCPEVFECLEHKKLKPAPPEEKLRAREVRHRTVQVRKPRTTKKKTATKKTKRKTKPKGATRKKKVTKTRKKTRWMHMRRNAYAHKTSPRV